MLIRLSEAAARILEEQEACEHELALVFPLRLAESNVEGIHLGFVPHGCTFEVICIKCRAATFQTYSGLVRNGLSTNCPKCMSPMIPAPEQEEAEKYCSDRRQYCPKSHPPGCRHKARFYSCSNTECGFRVALINTMPEEGYPVEER